MPGPNGESCSTCYYYDQIDDTSGYCRFENAEPWIEKPGTPAVSNWPIVRGALDWSGDWLESVSASAGFSALGALVTPRDTNFNVTDGTNWVKYDPGNLLPGAIMDNVTLANGVLTWAIPGSPPPSATYEAFASGYGSVTFPTANTFLEITIGSNGTPYSLNSIQRLQVNPQTDNISLPWSVQGVAPAAQNGTVEVLMRGTIGNGLFTSTVMQIFVERRT